MGYKIRNLVKRENNGFRDSIRDSIYILLTNIPRLKVMATTAGQDSKIVIKADVAQLVEQLIRNE